jgi:hypothetical protein
MINGGARKRHSRRDHTAMQHPIILHHFDQSPFSEKIRVVLGYWARR